MVFADWLFFALTGATLFVFRRRMPDARYGPYRCHFYPWVPLVFLLLASAMAVLTFVKADLTSRILGPGILLAGDARLSSLQVAPVTDGRSWGRTPLPWRRSGWTLGWAGARGGTRESLGDRPPVGGGVQPGEIAEVPGESAVDEDHVLGSLEIGRFTEVGEPEIEDPLIELVDRNRTGIRWIVAGGCRSATRSKSR